MKSFSPSSEITDTGDEGIESSFESLFERLSQSYSIEQVEQDFATLINLVYSLKRECELLDKLLDPDTPQNECLQIRQVFAACGKKLVTDSAELEKLHARIHELLEQCVAFITKEQSKINREAHKHSGYALQTCRLCKGLGKNSAGTRCLSCKDRKVARA